MSPIPSPPSGRGRRWFVWDFGVNPAVSFKRVGRQRDDAAGMNDVVNLLRNATRLLLVPATLGAAAVGVGLLGAGGWIWVPMTVVVVLVVTFAAEQVAPYAVSWNRRGPGFGADAVGAAVNELLTALGVVAAPVFAGLFSFSVWPVGAPRWVSLLLAIVVLDAGATVAHWWSHRRATLWRFHAVHHSADRLYGLNGLMKHPLHLAFETTIGMAPLIVLGIDSGTARALAGLVAVQLVLQHANVDYRVGRLGRWLAWNAGHRLHHVADEVEGNVNFGLFTLVWDRLLGTYRDPLRDVPPPVVGLVSRAVPSRYLEQLTMPWDSSRIGSADAVRR